MVSMTELVSMTLTLVVMIKTEMTLLARGRGRRAVDRAGGGGWRGGRTVWRTRLSFIVQS